MPTVEDSVRNQVRNIEKATGRSMDEWVALVKAAGKERHSEILNWLKAEHGFSHGNANLVALMAKRGWVAGGGTSWSTRCMPVRRPRCARSMTRSSGWPVASVADVELAPKQAYVSLRRSKQFGTVGPGPRGTLEIGLNLAAWSPPAGWSAVAGCAPTGSDWHRPMSSTPRSSAGSGRRTSEQVRSQASGAASTS